jgi:hypothetical protein
MGEDKLNIKLKINITLALRGILVLKERQPAIGIHNRQD